MYKFKDNQLDLTDFGAAVGLKLNPENRWIKKAGSIPWEEIELRYANLFSNRKGNVAKPLRLGVPTRKRYSRFRRGHIFSTSAVIGNTTTADYPSIRH